MGADAVANTRAGCQERAGAMWGGGNAGCALCAKGAVLAAHRSSRREVAAGSMRPSSSAPLSQMQ